MLAVDSITGERRPTSGAFQPDEDGVSVYRLAILEKDCLSPEDITDTPRNLVYAVNVSEIRQIGLDVVADPWPKVEYPRPRDAAHALIVGFSGLSVNERRRRQRALVKLPSMRCVYGPE